MQIQRCNCQKHRLLYGLKHEQVNMSRKHITFTIVFAKRVHGIKRMCLTCLNLAYSFSKISAATFFALVLTYSVA